MRSHRDNRFNRGLQTAVKHIGRLEKRVDIQGFRLTTAGNWLADYVLNFHGDCTMQIERARRLLRQRPEFAVVPQRMIQVVEQLLHYIQPPMLPSPIPRAGCIARAA